MLEDVTFYKLCLPQQGYLTFVDILKHGDVDFYADHADLGFEPSVDEKISDGSSYTPFARDRIISNQCMCRGSFEPWCPLLTQETGCLSSPPFPSWFLRRISEHQGDERSTGTSRR